jgi:glycosyltransferase involved in cell wall biosynthesis
MAQSKVSMVMTCYNKAKDITATFETVLAQEWDNIELILVDDGSTDGTSTLIDDYIPRFRNRGFEVTLVRQENAGVAAASKAGLERITGDYVCLVDCDDFFHRDYISTMAKYLDEHKDVVYVRCTKDSLSPEEFVSPVTSLDGFVNYFDKDLENRPDLWIKAAMLFFTCMATAEILVRTEYLHSCNLPEMFITENAMTQEPSYYLPILAGGGKTKYIEKALFTYNASPKSGGIAVHRKGITLDYLMLKTNTRRKLYQSNLDRIFPNDSHRRFVNECNFAADFYWETYLIEKKKKFNIFPIESELASLLEKVNKRFQTNYFPGDIRGRETLFFFAVRIALLGDFETEALQKKGGKIIAYGYLGEYGKMYLPFLGLLWRPPDENWDIRLDGRHTIDHKLSELSSDDVIVTFPLFTSFASTKAQVIPMFKIMKQKVFEIFPELINNSGKRDNV